MASFFSSEELASSILPPSAANLEGAYIFGKGAVGSWIRKSLQEHGVKIGGFVDNSSAKWHFNGENMPVLSPKEFADKHRNTPLILCTYRELAAMQRQCAELGITNAIPYYRCLWLKGIFPFEMRKSARETENDVQIQCGFAAWSDPGSQEKYRRLIRFFVNPGIDDELPCEEGQYFSPKYVPRGFLQAFADIGAYRGDTWEQFFQATGGDFVAYYAFEPDPANFAVLRETIPANDRRVHCFAMAVGDSPGETTISGAGDSYSRTGGEYGTGIPIDTLDHLLGDANVSLIKMDLEGAEPQALAGAEKLIRRRRPALAISVYHRMEHLWTIPQWIVGLNLGYRLSLGCHGRHNSEAICYAIPE